MHIILVSDRLATARSVRVGVGHLALAGLAFLGLMVGATVGLTYLAIQHAAEIKHPALQALVRSAQEQQARRSEDYVRQNLSVMAVKLGEMQAQLTRLDALGERLGSAAGIKPSELKFAEVPGRGGALVTSPAPRDIGIDELRQHLDAMAKQMEWHTEHLGMIEGSMVESRAKARQLPTSLPVAGTWRASGFGWRIDPITGQAAVHEGIDFIAESGTPIRAAAAGVVAFAGYHPTYGNLVEVDHGGGLLTRYAHASKLLVKQGEFVKRGAVIAKVGTTGRSTGSHLHFEVRQNGKALNPTPFLRGGEKAALAAVEGKSVSKAKRRTSKSK
ncbi:MAG: M23 family metallopeptidase [Betaproteobacteria bacterium]|jgi:murein DD-endopeptidase MepM/ murein hydrolase activator NlpD|nr:M23 family metallopeptidase [Betaproteobacteria bacterium]